jgi:hypothetical protein
MIYSDPFGAGTLDSTLYLYGENASVAPLQPIAANGSVARILID